jgi:hypothetical protein
VITRPRFPGGLAAAHCQALTVFTKTTPQRCQGTLTLKAASTAQPAAQISDQPIQKTRTRWKYISLSKRALNYRDPPHTTDL